MPNASNPWDRDPNFETIIRENIKLSAGHPLTVFDTELSFERDAAVAWQDPAAKAASGVTEFDDFEYLYYREWARWHGPILTWAKEAYPSQAFGLYGLWPFDRDYWGFPNDTIDESHVSDNQLWQHVDKDADFYAPSIYVFYDDPGSVYYMAANVEENYNRIRQYGDRPIYAYTWMRYHQSNAELGGQELAPYLIEAMAIVPFFSGASGCVLWGWEPGGGGWPIYDNLPTFLAAKYRLNKISEIINRGKLCIAAPAQELWIEKRPIIRHLIHNDWCVTMAVNPWQDVDDETTLRWACEGFDGCVTMRGKRITLLCTNLAFASVEL